MITQRWNNVPGVLGLEITPDLLADLRPEAISALTPYLDGYNLIIEFHSSGSYDPGRTYGDPYYCYPPETDDNRDLVQAYVEGAGRYPLPRDVQEYLFDKLIERVHEVELVENL